MSRYVPLCLLVACLLVHGCAPTPPPQTDPVQPPATQAVQDIPTTSQAEVIASSGPAVWPHDLEGYAAAMERAIERRRARAKAGAEPDEDLPPPLNPAEFKLTIGLGMVGESRKPAPRVEIETQPLAANGPATNPVDASPAVAGPVGPVRNFERPVGPAHPPGALDDVEARLHARLQADPKDAIAALDLQLVGLLRGDTAPDLEKLAALNSDDREIVAALLDCMANLRAAARGERPITFARKIAPILDMSQRLRASCDLRIPTLALCKSVTAFGVYQPVEPARFVAGEETKLILYVEVDHFASVQNSRREWETRLSLEAVLYTETGLPVWEGKRGEVTDVCRTRRNDFFLYKAVTLPRTLPVNRYLLKVTVMDLQANRVAESTLPIQITAN